MIATVPCPRHKPGCAPSAAEHCFPVGESRKGVSYGVQQHFCLSHGHGHGVLRADLPDRVDLVPGLAGRPSRGPGPACRSTQGPSRRPQRRPGAVRGVQILIFPRRPGPFKKVRDVFPALRDAEGRFVFHRKTSCPAAVFYPGASALLIVNI